MEDKNLSGRLADWSVSDLLQIMHVTKKSGSLEIAGERSGRIHFLEGAIVGADLSGARQNFVADDQHAIADVLYVLSALGDGHFAVKPSPDLDVDGSWEVEEILEDVGRMQQLESEVSESGLIEATAIRLSESVDGPMTLTPEQWKTVVGLVQPFSFAHLEARYGRGGAVRALHTLTNLEVAEAVSDDEAVWLDEVAVGVTPHTEPSPSPKHVAPVEEHGEVAAEPEPPADLEEELVPDKIAEPVLPAVKGVSAPASTTLTDGVYDEIRRLRSRVSEK